MNTITRKYNMPSRRGFIKYLLSGIFTVLFPLPKKTLSRKGSPKKLEHYTPDPKSARFYKRLYR